MSIAQTATATGITGLRTAAFFFALGGALLLGLIFRSTARHMDSLATSSIGSHRVGRALRRQSRNVLHDFTLPGAYGGLSRIDHAVLTPGGVLCIRARHESGVVFGSEDEAQWTNVDGKERTRFLNPLIENEGRTRALRAILPEVPIASLVVFTGDVQFSQPPPANVIQLPQLESFIAKFALGPSKVDDWDTVWLTLKSATVSPQRRE